MRFVLRSPRIVWTGVDGGHCYLSGTGEFAGRADVPIFAFLKNKNEEDNLEVRFRDSASMPEIVVEAPEWDYAEGSGLNLNDAELTDL